MEETIKFSDLVTFEGAKYSELTFDLDGLNGHDLLATEKEARDFG